ncbi:MAG: threonine synthase [Desulfobulbaceae bacterium]|nr:threonine synthase [Desulfobulbaceae bacterium]HIJ79047.1 threonine synthase [Deltaproteobacteria bacterium]
MKYISTRGGIAPISFKEAVMMGLAVDGGLLLPESIEAATEEQIESWRGLSYQELAFAVLSRFIDDIPAADLRELINRSYATFTSPAVTPIVKKGDCHIMELFHGPTLAFKDVALQFLGNVFEYLLKESGGHMNILGATSGDTGSAAIYGVRGKERINIFILHPHKRVSPIQELQMTSVTDANVFNLAIKGTFDDGQAIVKAIFNDIPFKDKHQLGAVNSINWARIVAQVVYYIYGALKVTAEEGVDQVDFSVPTGNFGDIFAGFVARRILPGRIRNLVLATNENNLLTRFVLNGDYSVGSVVSTVSPSMDIQVASNFERYLYYLNGEDAARTRKEMEQFAQSGSLHFDDAAQERVRHDFASRSVNEEETIAIIRDFYAAYGYVLDPHTAVGVRAGLAARQSGVPMICLSTAHPAKFGEAVHRAIGQDPEMPVSLAALADQQTRCEVVAAEVEAIKAFVDAHAL